MFLWTYFAFILKNYLSDQYFEWKIIRPWRILDFLSLHLIWFEFQRIKKKYTTKIVLEKTILFLKNHCERQST